MKLFTAKPSQEKLKYHEEQIHYTLDGTVEYNWRAIQAEIKELAKLNSMPSCLDFVTDKIKFEELDGFSWLKSDFKLPILKNSFISKITGIYKYDFDTFPIRIVNKKNEKQVNVNFSAFYIKSYVDCIDRSNSVATKYGELEYYDYRSARFMDNLDYPPVFKIKDISTPYMHFVTEEYKDKFLNLNLKGFDMNETDKTSR